MDLIHFFYEKTAFRLPNRQPIKGWIRSWVGARAFTLDTINIIFCDDAYLLEINRERLGHDYLTDIITFDYGNQLCFLRGDLYISIPRVKNNSILYQVRFAHELCRVIAHGLLHLMGHQDYSTAEQKKMRALEEDALANEKIAPYLQRARFDYKLPSS